MKTINPNFSHFADLQVQIYFVLLLALVLVTLPVYAESNPIGQRATFEPTRCWSFIYGETQTECGWLIVPEDWKAADSSKIKLAVAVYHALQPDDSLTPIIYLSGGPGVSSLGKVGSYMKFWRRTANNRFPGRTLIVFDQRGSGLSEPKFACPEMHDLKLWWPISKNPDQEFDGGRASHAAYRDCMALHFETGHQLHAFNTRQSANDVEALRHVLGFEKVVLYGTSYGTTLALTVMDQHPDHIEAAILDSVAPPPVRSTWDDADALGRVFDRLFEACDRDQGCAKAYPDLRGQFLRALAQLKREPVTIEITNLQSVDPLYAQIDHRVFAAVLRQELYEIRQHSDLPMLISGVSNGQYGRLKRHFEYAIYSLKPSAFTLGTNLVVRCNDDVGVEADRIRSLSSGVHAYLNDFVEWFNGYSNCEFWPTKIETQNREAVTSDIPSLILAGGLDPTTTLEHAELAAETLSNVHLFEFPALGHVQLRRNPCGWEVVGQFLDNPASRPDPACLENLRHSSFNTGDES